MGDKEGESDNAVKVMVRVRPFNGREMEISERKKELLRACVKMRGKTCAIVETVKDEKGFDMEREREAFEFDECFWSMPMEQAVTLQDFADQQYVYERSGRVGLTAAMAGYNVCIFAYGQTGSGKTHSMLGNDKDPGLSLKLVDEMFERIEETTTTSLTKVTVECMFYEVYNEKVRDLFNKKHTGDSAPKIRQHPTKGVFVDGLTRKEVNKAEPTKNLIAKGTLARAAAETKMNSRSSRSHAIFQLQITQNNAQTAMQRISSINLVDLAGSEKIKLSGVSGQALLEAKNINLSLSTLRRVIDVLIDNSGKPKKHQTLPPYRDAVLTYALSDSLGGNSKTMMIAAISPHDSNIEDTLGTLRYALRAKSIVCEAKVNEEKSAAMMDSMKDEILALQQKLKEGKGGGGGAASAEVKAQIAEREAEIKKMEGAQKDMEDLLAQATVREAELQAKQEEMEEQKAELDIAMKQQKFERFAAAFRNAFLIRGEQKKQEEGKVELDQLRKELAETKEANTYMNTELTSTRAGLDELQTRTDEQIANFVKDMSQRDQLITQLKRQVANQTEETNYMRSQNEALTGKVSTLEGAKLELERRIQRMQEEVLATSAAVEREKAERAKQKQASDAREKELVGEMDNLRKRKDKYKSMHMESEARAEAHRTIIDSLQTDRQAYMSALKSQQQVVAEQAATSTRLASDRKDAEGKVNALERKIGDQAGELKNCGEALREYQAASAEWMYENHAMSRELDRVTKGYNDLRGIADPSPAGASGSYGGSGSPPRASMRGGSYVDPRASASPIRGGSQPRY